MAKKFKKEEILPWIVALGLLAAVVVVIIFIQLKDKFTITPGPHAQGLLTITPEKACSMGPYLTQSGPNHEYCKKLWSTPEGRKAISNYTCMNGACGTADGMIPPGKNLRGEPLPGNPYGDGKFNGMPLHFQRTPMSNALWQNEMCNPPIL